MWPTSTLFTLSWTGGPWILALSSSEVLLHITSIQILSYVLYSFTIGLSNCGIFLWLPPLNNDVMMWFNHNRLLTYLFNSISCAHSQTNSFTKNNSDTVHVQYLSQSVPSCLCDCVSVVIGVTVLVSVPQKLASIYTLSFLKKSMSSWSFWAAQCLEEALTVFLYLSTTEDSQVEL